MFQACFRVVLEKVEIFLIIYGRLNKGKNRKGCCPVKPYQVFSENYICVGPVRKMSHDGRTDLEILLLYGDDAAVKIGVLLSGGVDSSTALVSLKEKHPEADITAYYLKIWLEDELASLPQEWPKDDGT